MSSPLFDVAVVGAGPAGSAVARRLALHGCTVVVFERSTFDAPRVGESLAPGVAPLLRDLGVWDAFLACRPLPSYGTRSAWGAPNTEDHAHLTNPYMNGWHVDRQAFDHMLADSAADAGADLRLGARVTRVSDEAADRLGLQVEIGNHGGQRVERVRARFVIDACGRRGAIARALGAERVVFDRLVGIGVTFEDTMAASQCYTLVEATPAGWWYSAPVSTVRSTAMFMTDGDLARRAGATHVAQWHRALARASRTCERVGAKASRPHLRVTSAVSQRTMRFGAGPKCWLSVGDAALAVDPISGSGVVRALRTAAAAALATSASLDGDCAAVDAYETDLNQACTKYLFERSSYYAAEPRWAAEPFWRRRIATAPAERMSVRRSGNSVMSAT